MPTWKEFDPFLQSRVEEITNKYKLIYLDRLSNLSEFKKRPFSDTLEHVTDMKGYKELVTTALSTAGARLQIMVNCLAITYAGYRM